MSVVAVRNFSHMQRPTHSEYFCTYCKSDDVVVDATFGDAICRGCGLVVCERMASLEAEWRDYDGDGADTSHRARASRAGDFDDGTIFFSGGMRSKQECDLLTKIQNQFGAKNQRIMDNMSDVSELTHKLGLGGQIKDQAKALYETAHLRGLARGGPQSGGAALIATSIYLACIQAGYSRTPQEIALVSGVSAKQILRMSTRILADEGVGSAGEAVASSTSEVVVVGGGDRGDRDKDPDTSHPSKRLKVNDDAPSPLLSTKTTKNSSRGPVPDRMAARVLPADLVIRIGSHMSLDSRLTDVARLLCQKATSLSLLSSVSPQCVAAAAVICVLHITEKVINITSVMEASTCSITNLSKTYSQMRPYIKVILPKEFLAAQKKGVSALPLQLEGIIDP